MPIPFLAQRKCRGRGFHVHVRTAVQPFLPSGTNAVSLASTNLPTTTITIPCHSFPVSGIHSVGQNLEVSLGLGFYSIFEARLRLASFKCSPNHTGRQEV
ncbi:hypothetical protein GALMADRAFT_218962 [Galerina marginata CBS 339.88]|uniref:Uncharacterized protein n=1 Tax=Galerina marginata (strain CBS 339.88) TaxID=685588 RepID=A0A067U0S3_GALM3|nr:hypothetical protein GALMADRAFT_218962 [Galerina marginata CBS 339.88]